MKSREEELKSQRKERRSLNRQRRRSSKDSRRKWNPRRLISRRRFPNKKLLLLSRTSVRLQRRPPAILKERSEVQNKLLFTLCC